MLTRVFDKTCYFKDGSAKDFDAIILCTGYLHHFPFLPDNLRLTTENRLWPLGLYHDIDAVNKLFFEWKQHKIENFMTFRDHAYRSAITGHMSALQRTAWQDAHDDTLEAYLQDAAS